MRLHELSWNSTQQFENLEDKKMFVCDNLSH